MSISLWDPFRTSRSVAPFYPRRSLFMDPFEQLERSMNQLDQFFDQSMNVQLRDHAAQLNIDKDSGQLSYKVDTSGFRPEELKVDLEGNQLTVRGEHREENEGETVHRQFVRSVVIPEGIQRESIKCDLDNQGRLCIIGMRNQQPTRSIPIDFKQQQQQAQIGQQQPQDQQKLR